MRTFFNEGVAAAAAAAATDLGDGSSNSARKCGKRKWMACGLINLEL